MIVANNPNRIINSKAASIQTVVTDMGGSSSGEAIYQCGLHDFQTKNLKEFNEHVERLPHDDSSGSKAASVPDINKVKVIHDFLKSDGRL
jgi:hypothetical protein